MAKSEEEIVNTIRAFQVSREEAETVEYLGDGVYASFDGYQVWLRAYNGRVVHDCIAVEPPVMQALVAYATRNAAVSA